jgi:RNA polymerase sigma-70 factor (ECF subfamily)
VRDTEKSRDFVILWSAHARRVYAYVLTLVNNWADADDVFQETSATLWEKIDEFEPGTDFGAWACRIAYFKALSLSQSHRKFELRDQLFMEAVEAGTAEIAAELDSRFLALQECMNKLATDDRTVMSLRYAEGRSPQQIAEQTGRSLSGIYKLLRRVHESLFKCIQRRIARERRS